jgi:hypothetical protein
MVIMSDRLVQLSRPELPADLAALLAVVGSRAE